MQDYHDLSVSDLSGLLARNLVESQFALDRYAEEGLDLWDNEGIPPSAFQWSTCCFRLSVSYRVQSQQNCTAPSQLRVSPTTRSLAQLSLKFQYLPPPQEGFKEEGGE